MCEMLFQMTKIISQHSTDKEVFEDYELLAVPFDKGIEICLIKINTYNNKMRDIIATTV